MAKFEFIHPENENTPGFSEVIEARVWGVCGTQEQPFYIGSGLNFAADGNLWLEISYSVQGAQIFYTRNFLHMSAGPGGAGEQEAWLDEVVKEGKGDFGFGDMLPETSLMLTLDQVTYEDNNDEEQQATHCHLKISIDTGTVFGRSGPGQRFVNIELKYIDVEKGVRFFRELIHEIEAVKQGKHPDPANYPAGSSDWPLFAQLNRQAYNKISEDYQEAYFVNPLLTEAFDGWLAQLPAGGRILDAGCGHGDPVIARLLENGFQVTGSDFSPEMLRRAFQAFPQANFIQQATTEIAEQAVFDGVCSFNSVLYLDLIDLLNSIYRLHAALKPGGLLFLFGFDSGPDWRGEPYAFRVGQWMWGWHYGMEEAARLLEEHGYFEVIETLKVQVDEAEAQRLAEALEKQKQEEEEFLKRQEVSDFPFKMPYPKLPVERSPYGYVIIARSCER